MRARGDARVVCDEHDRLPARVKLCDEREQRLAVGGIEIARRLVGEEDEITPLEMSQAMVDQIPGATLSIIPGAGHISNLEAPTAFEAALRAWLRRKA